MSTVLRALLVRATAVVVATGVFAGIATGSATAQEADGTVPTVADAQLSQQVRDLEGWMIDDLNQQWGSWFSQNGFGFAPAEAQIVNPGMEAQTKCGPLRSDTPNAFYCHDDGTIWLPLDSLVSMMRSGRFGNVDDPQLTNFDIALIVSHEYGHYVQDLLERDGVPVRTSIRTGGDVGIEDFADCAAGHWTRTADDAGRLETGDLDSGLRMIEAMGDATPTLGAPDPHGTPRERSEAFGMGFDQGPLMCANRFLGTPITSN